MKQSEIIENLKNFSPTADGDWTEFIELLDKLWTTKNPERAYKTLFDLLIKFDNDYMECQWGIIHGIEHFGNYESELIDSLKFKPVDMTLTMLSRIINTGEKIIDNSNIDTLLNDILNRTDIDENLKELAQDCMTRLETSHNNN